MSLYSQFATEQLRIETLPARPGVVINCQNISTLLGRDREYCGVLTATVEKEVINRSGAGSLKFLSISSVDATPRTITATLYIDDPLNPVWQQTFSTSTANYGRTPIGISNSASGIFLLEPIEYRYSWSLSIISDLTETDKVEIAYYDVWKTSLF